MFSSKRSPLKVAKHSSVVPGHSAASRPNPFDSDDEYDTKKPTVKSSSRSSSEPKGELFSNNPFEDYEAKGTSSLHVNPLGYATKNRYKNDFRDSGGLENQSVQELENYAVYKAEETTKSVNNCLKIAEGMREDATNTLVVLHQQGEQITRAHMVAAHIDYDLTRGEKLLGSLGGLFSKTWKPKKTRPIVGPTTTRDDVQRKGNHLEQREKLGLGSAPKDRANSRAPLPESASSLQKVEVEKAKQDGTLSDLSNILGELKNMAIDMGSEIDRHNKALDPFHNDADVLVDRVKQANQRGRRLLRK